MRKVLSSRALFFLATTLFIYGRALNPSSKTMSGAILIGVLGLAPFLLLVLVAIQAIKEHDYNKMTGNLRPDPEKEKRKPKRKSQSQKKKKNTEPYMLILINKIRSYYKELGNRSQNGSHWSRVTYSA